MLVGILINQDATARDYEKSAARLGCVIGIG